MKIPVQMFEKSSLIVDFSRSSSSQLSVMGIEICQRLVLKTPLSLDVILIITLALPHFVYGQ